MVSYYRARAQGGAGLIIVESAYVNTERPIGHLAVHTDYFIPGLNRLAEAIKEEGCRAFLQINHRGALFGKKVNDLTRNEIYQLIKDFGKGAVRARQAGFDGIEIHGGNAYVMHQFLSPRVNQRKDEFGSNLEGRIRFPLLVYEECRAAVGDSFPISFRLNGDEFIEGGWDVAQAGRLAMELDKRGVSAIHVTGGGMETRYWHTQPMALPRGCLVPVARQIKKQVLAPIIAVGRINNPALAEKILRDGDADLIAVGRGLIADPQFPIKASKGEEESINSCIACNYCRSRIVKNYPLRCASNPMAGRETEFRAEKSKVRKKVWVVGGGPAGMAAAKALDERGHDVSLFESKEKLGGQIQLAVLPPCKDELKNLLNFLVTSVKRSGTRVFLRETVTLTKIEEARPDAVVIATGSKPLFLELGHPPAMQRSARQVLEQGAEPEKIYVVVGGGLVGCETAEFLADQGKAVTIVEVLPEIGMEYEPNTRALLLQRLKERGVTLLPGSEIVKIVDKKVHLRDKKTNAVSILDSEIIVFACGARSEKELWDRVKSVSDNVFLIGDARDPRGIAEAIFEGTKIADQI